MFLGISLKSLVPLKSFLMSKMTRKVALSLVMCFQLGTRSLIWFTASSAWLGVSEAAAGVSVLQGGSWISVIEFGPLQKIDDSKISHMKILHTATDSTVLIVFLVEPCFFFRHWNTDWILRAPWLVINLSLSKYEISKTDTSVETTRLLLVLLHLSRATKGTFS